MKHKLKYLLLSLLFISSCGKNEVSSSKNEETTSQLSSTIIEESSQSSENKKELDAFTLSFIDKVNKYGNVTLESKDDLDLMLVMYLSITKANDELKNDDEVKQAKTKLDSLIETYNSLKSSNESTQMEEAYENRLIEFMNSNLKEVSSFLLEDYENLLTANYYYDSLPTNSKQKDQIKDLKETLDLLSNRYNELLALTNSQYNALVFVIKVNKLDVATISYDDIDNIDSLNELYLQIKTEDRTEDVVNANNKLKEANNITSTLKTYLEHADAFMKAAFSLPVSASLRYQDATQRKQINDALAMYDALNTEEKKITGVYEAYVEAMQVKETFESLKEPYSISLITAGWNFPNGEITYSSSNPVAALANKYGYNINEIDNYLTIRMDIYVEGGAVIKDNIPKGNLIASINITKDNYHITTNDIKKILKEAFDNGDSRAFSGEHYCFTIQIVSLNDNYGNSYYQDFFGRQVISY